ncbi:MAG: cation diffusion facilitator family transporter [Mariprofundaceae bacterium]|nr:cation diffusion facilitator family transporter [Mariprofundaceae bacterium]
MSHGSTKTVIAAIIGNSIITTAKFIGFFLSGSSALLAEAIHSLADTANQCLLYLGLKRASRKADIHHHFGYGQEQYFWNLISAVTIFFLGCIYTILHTVGQIQQNHQPEMSWIPFSIIGLAFMVEGFTFSIALKEFLSQCRSEGKTVREYFFTTPDPTTLAVLIEDSVAMLGLLFAVIGIGLSMWTGYAIFDGIAAIAIGLLMGALALFLASTNRKYLLNYSDDDVNEVATRLWTSDAQVQAVPLVNSIVLSPRETLLMAEVELREEAMFADMSEAEIQQAIRFMRKLNAIRRSLEEDVIKLAPEAKYIFIEFASPPVKPDKNKGGMQT